MLLSRLLDSLDQLQAMDIRLTGLGEARVSLLLPHADARPRAGSRAVDAARQLIARELEVLHGGTADLSRIPAASFDFAQLPPLVPGFLQLLALCARAEEEPDSAGGRLVILEGTQTAVDEQLAAVIRAGRYTEIQADTTSGSDDSRVLVRFDDDAALGGRVNSLQAAGYSWAPKDILRAHPTSGGELFLDASLTVPTELLSAAGALFGQARLAGLLPADAEAAAIIAEPGGHRIIFLQQEFQSVDPIFEAGETQPGLTLRTLSVQPAADSVAMLTERINAVEFPLGYRVSLAAVPERVYGSPDVEVLREEIDQLEEEIALINAMNAPQLRLMRFTDAQLPAMVDGLRRLPPDFIRHGSLQYASGHLVQQTGPVHYLLFDPDDLTLQGTFPEALWRLRTEDEPISYWLDPYSAEARQFEESSTLVFTPRGRQLIPGLSQFGTSIDGTLRLVLGNLFAADIELMADPEADLMFIFSDPVDASHELAVEVLDRREFGPFQSHIKWINHYMQVRSPQAADPETLALLAEDLYEGVLARRLREDMADTRQEVRDAWELTEARVRLDIDDMLERLTSELKSYAEIFSEVFERLESAHMALQQQRELADEASSLALQADRQITGLTDGLEKLENEQNRFLELVQSRSGTAARVVADTHKRVAELRKLIETLRQAGQ